MSSTTPERAELPARAHAQLAELLRRPFAPGAIGFRAMMKVPLNGDPFGRKRVRRAVPVTFAFAKSDEPNGAFRSPR